MGGRERGREGSTTLVKEHGEKRMSLRVHQRKTKTKITMKEEREGGRKRRRAL